jgi:hypothetical protein
MRELVDAERLRQFMRAIGREARQNARAYLTGGSSAVLLGWRNSTVDVDLTFEPEEDRIHIFARSWKYLAKATMPPEACCQSKFSLGAW